MMTSHPTPATTDLGLVLGGGGARGAYQVGVLRAIAARYPHLQIPILVGVSAGSVNATHLAAHRGTFAEAMEAGNAKRLADWDTRYFGKALATAG